jgi:hypothetical protein
MPLLADSGPVPWASKGAQPCVRCAKFFA